VIDIPRLFYGDMLIDLQEFMVGIIGQIGLDIKGGLLCFGIGW
jgi:hypothetical protein